MKILKWLAAAVVATGLTACNDNSTPVQGTFTATVSAVVSQPAVVSDVVEPVSLAAVMTDSSETAEPVTVIF